MFIAPFRSAAPLQRNITAIKSARYDFDIWY
jgi:hypothetical protein